MLSIKKKFSLFFSIILLEKRDIFKLAFYLFISVVSEILFLLASMPFFSIILGNNSGNKLSNFFQLNNLVNLNLQQISLFFLISLFISSGTRFMFLRFKSILLSKMTNTLSFKLNQSVLNLNYTLFNKFSSKNYVDLLTNKSNTIMVHYFEPILNLGYFIFSSASIFIVMLYVNFSLTIASLVVFLFFYYFLSFLIFKRNRLYVDNLVLNNTLLIEKLQTSYFSFVPIKLDNTEELVTNDIKLIDLITRTNSNKINLLSSLPRIILEPLIYVLIILLLFYLALNDLITQFIPVLGFIIFASQKLLPNLSGISTSYSLVKSCENLVGEITRVMLHKREYSKNIIDIDFNKSVVFDDVSFGYGSHNILNNFSFTFQKNLKYFICGSTGKGKSTLINLIVSLLKPTSGKIYIDNIELSENTYLSWRSKISYVTQSSYFENSTFIKLITRNSNDINFERLNLAMSISLVDEILDINQYDLYTPLGENANVLSGGQKQRLAIARAIYDNKDVLVFDESTNALDTTTENRILKNLLSLEKSIFFISHNLDIGSKFDFTLDLNLLK